MKSGKFPVALLVAKSLFAITLLGCSGANDETSSRQVTIPNMEDREEIPSTSPTITELETLSPSSGSEEITGELNKGEDVENTPRPEPAPSTVIKPTPEITELNSLQDQLELIKREPENDFAYDADAFCGWNDLDGDGLNTREEILLKEKVEDIGWWYSRWDGYWYEGEGELKARYFDIDHIVSKKEAWQSGAYAWTYNQRCQFANDVLNLTAVTFSSNRSKGARDAGEWLPSEPSGKCYLVIRVIQVKKLWDLTVDETEYSQLRDLVAGCEPNVPEIPSPPREPTWPLEETEEDSTTTPPIPVDQTNNESSNQFYQTANGVDIDIYDANANGDINCGELPSAARPVIVISPGSDPYRLDGDNDGIGCEG